MYSGAPANSESAMAADRLGSMTSGAVKA